MTPSKRIQTHASKMCSADATAPAILRYLSREHPRQLAFWLDGARAESSELMPLCDVLYALRLSGRMGELPKRAAVAFADLLRRTPLAGRLTEAAGKGASVHLTAYALGALNLLSCLQPEVYRRALHPDSWALNLLIDPATALPRWPAHWAHHCWRVSHWIGGAAMIALALERAMPNEYARAGGRPSARVLDACERTIDPHTGLLKVYKSRSTHAAFNALYSIRHDPLAAEIGGVAHLHWVNYAAGRLPLYAHRPVFAAAASLLPRERFIERTPYCLDFDIIQILRAASVGASVLTGEIVSRVGGYRRELAAFLHDELDGGYQLHRLPGALAALHECDLFLEPEHGAADIIREAFWL